MQEWNELTIFERIKVSHGAFVLFIIFAFATIMLVQLGQIGDAILTAMVTIIAFVQTNGFKLRYIIRQEIRQLKKKKGGM